MATEVECLAVENNEDVGYVNAQLVEGDDDNTVPQLEAGEDDYNVAYASDGHTIYVQQGQYIIPVGGQTVVLHDDEVDFEQYIIGNIVTEEDLQDVQTEEEVEQPVVYYASDFTDSSRALENGGENISESADSMDESNSLSAVMPLSQQIKLEQAYAIKNEEASREYDDDDFVELEESNDCDTIVMASTESDRVQLQQPQYQYAILKNGKLHLQTLDIVDATVDQNQLGILEDGPQHQQLQEQLAAFQRSINMDEASGMAASTVNLDKITGKNLITGQTVTLDSYFDKLQRRLATVDVTDQCTTYTAAKRKRRSSGEHGAGARGSLESNVAGDSFINKKVVVGKTSNGKRIVGKILRVHMTGGGGGGGGADLATKHGNGEKETSDKEAELSGGVPSSTLTAVDDNDAEATTSTDFPSDSNTAANENPQQLQPHIIIKKHIVTRENFDYNIGKTLAGLMSLETVQRRLQNKNLVVKLVEKLYDHGADAFNRTVSYVYGHMDLVEFEKEGPPESRRWAFVLHGEKETPDAETADTNQICESTEAGEPGPPAAESPLLESQTARLVGNDDLGDEDKDEFGGSVKDVSLEMEEAWSRHNETVSLTIVITVDKSGKKATRVNLSPQQPDSRCHVCDKEFKTTLQMRKHVNNVHLCERSAKCELCDKNFANQTVLQRHRKIHTGERWYQCPKCSKSFNTAGSLKRHLTVHDPSLRPLECSVCVQRFTDESSLRKHLLIHTGIRAYACEVCYRAFINQGDLNFHRRIHDPVKQFSCEVCGREFSRHSNLMRHSEIHRGVGALHRCDICGCSYSFVSSLTRHIVQKHIGQSHQQ